jgi:hypothetical protein
VQIEALCRVDPPSHVHPRRIKKLEEAPKAQNGCRTINNNSILVYLGAKLNSLKANYKVNT